MKNANKRSFGVIACVFLLAINMLTITGFSDEFKNSEKVTENFIYSFSFEEPSLRKIEFHNEQFTELEMPGTYSVGNNPGDPIIQIMPAQVLLPRGIIVNDITISAEAVEINTFTKGIDLKEKPIIPYQSPVPIGKEPSDFIINQDTYESRSKIPIEIFENLGVDYCHGYTILTVNLFPIQYIPIEGRLFYYPEMTIELEVEETGFINEFYRNNPEDEAWVKSLVINPDITETYNSGEPNLGDPLYIGGLCQPSDNGGLGYDYVIITRQSLADFTAAYNWTDLINKKASEGLTATLVTVEDISSCPDYWNSDSLFNDTEARIREFCRDAYEDWTTQYVLIAGDHAGAAAIPRRLMETSYESNIETDIYWSNLDNTFNEDHDSYWGEAGDAGFDLYSELFIGSIPCDEPTDISNWLTKNIYYADSLEQDYLENAAFYGGDTGWNCQGDDFMDFTIFGTDDWLGPNPHNDGPWPSWLGFLYGFDTWNNSNPGNEFNTSIRWTGDPPNSGWQGGSESAAIAGLKNAINNDHVTLLSGIAHANSDMSLDVYASSWESSYHNTKPFFIHDFGCHCGDMSASDDGVLHSMLFHSDTELSFACVMNTCYGWGNLDSTNSSSALQQKLFWDYMFNVSKSGGSMNWQLGKAQAFSKDVMAPTINWDPSYGTWRAIIQGCLLFGDPAQKIKPPTSAEHNVGVQSLDFSSHVEPDIIVYINATIVNNGQNDESNVLVSFRVNGTELDSTTIPFFENQTIEQVNFTWTPSLGWYTVTINVSIPGVTEDFYTDNEKSQIVIAGPDIAVTNIDLPTYAGLNVPTTIEGTVVNLGVTDEPVTVNLKVDGVIKDTQSIYLNNGESSDVSFVWNPTQTGTYPVTIHAELASAEPFLGNNQKSKDITVFAARGYILLVDDDEGDPYETYYEDALLASGYLYDIWDRDTEGSPTESTMSSYDAVVWFTGDDSSSTLISTDIANLENYLDAGGRLFISGQDIGYDIRTDSFYSNYLHASYNVDDTNIFRLDGVPGDPISDNLAIEISSGDGANNQDWPEGISPISPATKVFTYESSSHDGAIKFNNSIYKVVYFGFGFEAISTMSDRIEVMSKTLIWLVGAYEPVIITDIDIVPQVQETSGWVNISCNVASVESIDVVKVNVTYPDESFINQTMENPTGTNDYYFNNTFNQFGRYSLFIWANDTNNNHGISDVYYFYIGVYVVDIPLITGWNQITIPVENNWMASTLGENITGCTQVSYWNNTPSAYQDWLVGYPDPEDDYPIEDGRSYFVYVSTDSVLQVYGDPVVSVSVPIGIGWNMIGWYEGDSTMASSIGENITGCTQVSYWNNTLGGYQDWLVDYPDPEDDYPIHQGMGFFVYTDETSIWHGEG